MPIDRFRLLAPTLGPEKIPILDCKENVMRISRLKRSQDLQRFVEAALSAKENDQHDLRVSASFTIASGCLVQIFKALFLASAKANHAGRRLDAPRKAAHHVV